MFDYTWQDLRDLDDEWESLFGETMPRGFEIGPAHTPLMRECIEKRSIQPLVRYIKSLPPDRLY